MATRADLGAVAPGEGPLDELIASLVQAGEVDSYGEFTLDRQKARQKLQRFQLTEPARYVLELVQAAVLRGAQYITVQIEHNDIHLRCDATPFTLQDFEQIYDALFIRARADKRQALRHLALGVSTALSLRSAWVRIEGGGTQGAYLQLFPGDKEKRGAAPQASVGLHVHVRQRGRLGFLWRLLGYYEEPSPAELEILREHCGLSMVPIEVNGLPITCGYQLPGTMQWLQYQHGNTRGVIGIRGYVDILLPAGYPFGITSTMHLMRNCVSFEIDMPPLLLPGFGTLVESPSFHLDISHQRVVRNESYAEAVRLVLAQQIQLLVRECKRLHDQKSGISIEMLAALVLALLSRLGSVDPILRWAGRADAGPTLTPRDFPDVVPGAAALLAAPLWLTAMGTRASLNEILLELQTFGTIAVKTPQSPGVDPNRPLVLSLRDATIVEVFSNVFAGRLEGSHLAPVAVRQHAVTIKPAGTNQQGPRLPAGEYLAKVKITTPNILGEVGVAWFADVLAGAAEHAEKNPQPSQVALQRPDGVRVVKDLAGSLQGLQAILAGPFTPSYVRNEVLPDGYLAQALHALLNTLPALVDQILLAGHQSQLEALRLRTVRELTILSRSASAQAELLQTFELPAPDQAAPPVPLLRLSGLRVFPTLGGEVLTLDELRRQVNECGGLEVLDQAGDIWRERWQKWNQVMRRAGTDFPEQMAGKGGVARPTQHVIWQSGTVASLREALGELIPAEQISDAADWLAEPLTATTKKAARQAGVPTAAESADVAPARAAPAAVQDEEPPSITELVAAQKQTPFHLPASSASFPDEVPSAPAAPASAAVPEPAAQSTLADQTEALVASLLSDLGPPALGKRNRQQEETRILLALRNELRAIAGSATELLPDVDFGTLRIDEHKDALAVVCTKEETLLNRSDAVMRRALGEVDEDPAVAWFVLSAVCTARSLFTGARDGADTSFLSRLTRRAIAALAAAEGKTAG